MAETRDSDIKISRIENDDASSWDNGAVRTSYSHLYLIEGTDDEHYAVSELKKELGNRGLLYGVSGYSLDSRLTSGVLKVAVEYDAKTTAEYNSQKRDLQFSFSASPSMVKIQKPVKWLWKSDDREYPDWINCVEGEIKGVEVPTGTFVKTFNKTFKMVDWSVKYESIIASLFGKLNRSSWKGYARGQVLFLGAEASSSGTGKDQIIQCSFKFGLSAYEKNVDFHGFTIPEKWGWDYYFPEIKMVQQEITDASGNVMSVSVPKTIAAYGCQVHELGNFELLKI